MIKLSETQPHKNSSIVLLQRANWAGSHQFFPLAPVSICRSRPISLSIPFSVQNGSSTVQNGNSSFQNGNSSIQNGNSSVQNGNSSVQNGKIIISINIEKLQRDNMGVKL